VALAASIPSIPRDVDGHEGNIGERSRRSLRSVVSSAVGLHKNGLQRTRTFARRTAGRTAEQNSTFFLPLAVRQSRHSRRSRIPVAGPLHDPDRGPSRTDGGSLSLLENGNPLSAPGRGRRGERCGRMLEP